MNSKQQNGNPECDENPCRKPKAQHCRKFELCNFPNLCSLIPHSWLHNPVVYTLRKVCGSDVNHLGIFFFPLYVFCIEKSYQFPHVTLTFCFLFQLGCAHHQVLHKQALQLQFWRFDMMSLKATPFKHGAFPLMMLSEVKKWVAYEKGCVDILKHKDRSHHVFDLNCSDMEHSRYLTYCSTNSCKNWKKKKSLYDHFLK